MRLDCRVNCLIVCLFTFGCDGGSSFSGADDGTSQAPPWFVDEAQQRGLDFQFNSGHLERFLIPETIGGGAALADLDGDGDLDVYLIQGGSLLTDDVSGNKLFLNRGDGHFTEVAGPGDTGYGMGVAAGDYDNDGDIDLYITNLGPNVLLRNNGNAEFEDVSVTAGVDDPAWGTGAVFLDLDVDGDLDLFVVNYLHWSLSIERGCFNTTTGLEDYCPPNTYRAPARDRLYRNDGDGTFTDISDSAGLAVAFGNGLGVVGLDANDDGLTDIFVANDMMPDQLWLNRGDLHFVDEAVLWGCAVDEHGVVEAGMGVAAADQDNDGDTDLLVVNLAKQTDSFFRNTGSYFEDATVAVGLATGTHRYTRFGVAMVDFDNDLRLDLFEATGAIIRSKEPVTDDSYAEPNLLLRGIAGARFAEVEPEGGTQRALVFTSRGVAIGDVDNDGGMDLLVVNRDAPINLLMNKVSHRGNWIRFRVLTRDGRDAHGATVSANIGLVRARRDVQTAGSYLASNDPRVHFGLGNERWVRGVRVRWPGKSEETFGDFEAGRSVELREGEGIEAP